MNIQKTNFINSFLLCFSLYVYLFVTAAGINLAYDIYVFHDINTKARILNKEENQRVKEYKKRHANLLKKVLNK